MAKNRLKHICVECALLCGKQESQMDPKIRFYRGTCGICGQTHTVSDPHWWGYLSDTQARSGRSSAKTLGIHISKKANADDVRRLIDVVKGVLGEEGMCFETKEIIKSLEYKLESGIPIQVYDTKLLSIWYATQCKPIRKECS